MKRFAILLTVFVLFVTATVVSAQEKEAPAAGKCKSAALDSETKVKLEKLKLQYQLDMVDLEAEKDQLHKAVMAEFMKDEPSKKAIDKIAKDVDGVTANMHKIKMDYMFKARGLLTADQFKGFIHKMHGCAPGCTKPCCSKSSSGKKCSSSCKSSATKCSMAGTEGHTCTSACTSSGAKSGCKTPCVQVKK